MVEHQAKFSTKGLQAGDSVGVLSLIARHWNGRKTYWDVRCNTCGQERSVRSDALYHWLEQCACPRRYQAGDRFGSYELVSVTTRDGRRYWQCKCDCGKSRELRAEHLDRFQGRTCLCSHPSKTHGLSKTREYSIWAKMLLRCYRPENDNYRWYGAIGHYVCERWRDSFENFLADMGEAPSTKHTLDRIDTTGSYTCGHCDECNERGQPENCRWATKAVQVRNCKNNINITHDGRTMILKDWARELGINYHVLYNRMHRDGKSFEDSIKPLKR